MRIPNRVKEVVLDPRSPVRPLWASRKRSELIREYRQRRESYHEVARASGLIYTETASRDAVQERLASRGYKPNLRRPGEVHTFAFIPSVGWHPALLPDLQKLGPVTHFDYTQSGYTMDEFVFPSADTTERRRSMNKEALERLQQVHSRCRVDWIFVYASGVEVTRDFVTAATDTIGAPVVNMCLDDKQSWTGKGFGNQRAGQIDIAAAFDLSWTSARVACEWYLAIGAIPLYLPEGFDAGTFRPRKVPRDLDVSFIGGAYGFRPDVIHQLSSYGIDVDTFGPGWKGASVWGEQQVEVLNRSRINLGMGGIGYSATLTNVKTRDFEIPGTGGGVYLTTFNSDLAQHFDIGDEILCYSTLDELVEQIRYYLSHPEEAEAISARGRERCMQEHRWLHRYVKVLEILGVVEVDDSDIEEP